MFRTFFTSELKYLFRQPAIYIYIFFFGLIEFLTTLNTGNASEIVYRNAPFIINKQMLTLGLFALIVILHFFNSAALRDYKYEFHEILFTTPIHRFGYFFGRFCAVWFVVTLPYLAGFFGFVLGTLIGPALGWADASRFGPFYIQTFIDHYLFFILPNVFVMGGIIYAISSRWKSTLVSFVGVFVIFISFAIASALLRNIHYHDVVALIDILGINLYSIETRYYTAVEKNTIPSLWSMRLLYNRMLWMGISGLALFISYRVFSFKNRNKKGKKQQAITDTPRLVFNVPPITIAFQAKTTWLQFKSFIAIHFLSMVKNITFKIAFICCLILLGLGASFGSQPGDVKLFPLTYRIIDNLHGNMDIFFKTILMLFSGELIWRDRDVKINEVMDATAHNSIISVVAKAFSLTGIIAVMHLSFIAVGVVRQLLSGYTRIELDVYFLDFLYNIVPRYFIYSGMVCLVQTLIQNRYLGYFASLLILFAWNSIFNVLGITTNMLHIANGPSLQYSDLNGFGSGLKGALWFSTYWILVTILCLYIAGAIWQRGTEHGLWKRLKGVKKRTSKKYRRNFAIITLLWMVTGSYIFYNTKVLNSDLSGTEIEKRQVAYEKKYKKYENAVRPKITKIKYEVAIFPSERNVDAKAHITLTNTSKKAIDTLHFFLDNEWETTLSIPNARTLQRDSTLWYAMYKLDTPLRPQTSITITADARYRTKGFENTRGNTTILTNGTMLEYRSFLPQIGYDNAFELRSSSTRKAYGLSPKIQIPKLEKTLNANHMKNMISRGISDFIDVETVISTNLEQTAIAPGSLVKQWEDGGRAYYHYKTDTPSLNYHTFNSGIYEIAKRQWKEVTIEVYYDKKHSTNIGMMMDAVERGLTYYTTHFGPYYHKQFRVIEVPRYVRFGGKAFPGTILYNEAAGFVADLEGTTVNNRVNAVIAHELAHQWWAHQLIGAHMQGNTMLSESLAEYSTLMNLKALAKTPMDIRGFLQYDHDLYLRGRSDERSNEVPLYKVEHQSYISYGKGSIVMYALQDFIGEEKVNTALKGFLEKYRYQNAPYPSTLDFLDDYLKPQVPDSLDYLITDWFKEITLYDNYMKNASYKELKNGKYAVTLEIEAHKIKADSIGNETRVRMNDWIDVGFFLDEDEKRLHHQKQVKIHEGHNKFTFELDTLPVKAAIDPRHIFIDKNYDDNIKIITR